MSGSVFFALIGFIALLLLTIFMSPLFIIPAVVVVLFFALSAPLTALLSGSRRTTGTPTTREASYEPVSRPEEHAV